MKWTSDVESIESHVAGHSALLVDDRDRASRRFKQGRLKPKLGSSPVD